MDEPVVEEAAALIAREQAAVRSRRPAMPAAYADPDHCRVALEELLADGYIGFVAHDEGRAVGVTCGRTSDSVGFIPAHGLAVAPDLVDPTIVVVRLFAEVGPVLLRDGATRFTIDHVDLDPLGGALHNTGFGGGSVFGTQPARPAAGALDVDVRVGTADDLDSIAALSQIEFAQRFAPPIYASPLSRSSAEARELHDRLLHEGAAHFLARRDHTDVGLLTVELTSPAPRLCPNAQPYIGATATHPSQRGQGIGRALVEAALDWAYGRGYETVSVDFESANPLARPFWLGIGFEPTGYRVRRMIDASYGGHAGTGC
ncbi:MAG TPA: GNAT family N-acetyltransferase [Nocardioidaceae bacterium]